METVTLTYTELAARLGVKDESARKTVQRRKWRKFMGNDGFTRVEVPLDELPKVEEPPPPPGPTAEQIIAALRETNARLEAERDGLRETVRRLDGVLEEQKAACQQWQKVATTWQDRAGRWHTQLLEAKKTRRPLFSWRRANGKHD